MVMKLLLDTSAYVGFRLGIRDLVEYLSEASTIYLSPVVLGELYLRFRRRKRFKENLKDLNRFLDQEMVEVIPMGEITVDRYARIAEQLFSQGTPIPGNDIWIAAQAMEYGAELLTMDRHFEKIPGLVYRLFVR